MWRALAAYLCSAILLAHAVSATTTCGECDFKVAVTDDCGVCCECVEGMYESNSTTFCKLGTFTAKYCDQVYTHYVSADTTANVSAQVQVLLLTTVLLLLIPKYNPRQR